jgi:glycosyltransferase involved in cell wall biosynthesis
VSVAIIIPVYQTADYLAQAIASAAAQSPAELIVIDDGSPAIAAAEITRICAGFPAVTLLRQPHAGAAAARHAGVLHATAENILFLDADDLLQPGALDYFTAALRCHPYAIATYARLQNIDATGTPFDAPRPDIMPSGRALLHALLEKEMLIYNGTICIRRTALLALNPDNFVLTIGEDWVLWCHLALSGDIVPAGTQTVLHYRRHSSNASSALLSNPAPVFASIDAVFQNPRFKTALADQWQPLYDTCRGRMHAYLASAYARLGQHQAATTHMAQGSRYIKNLAAHS